MKRALAILTDEQKAIWKKLVGQPFTHPIQQPWKGNFGGFGFGRGGFVAPAVPVPLPPAGGGNGGVKILPAPAQPVPPVDPGK